MLRFLLYSAAFHLGGPHHVLVPGVVPPQVRDFALSLVELHEIPASPFLYLPRCLWMAAQPFCVLDASPTSVSSANSLRVYVVPSCRSSLETFNRTGASTNQPLRYTASHWLQTSLCSIGHHHPGLAIQPVFSPLHCSSIPLHQWLLYEDLTGDSVKGHAEVQVNNTYCSPLFSQASHFIVKIYQSSRSTMTSPW